MTSTTVLNDVNIEAVGGLIGKIQEDATKADTQWKAEVTWTGGFRTESRVRGFEPFATTAFAEASAFALATAFRDGPASAIRSSSRGAAAFRTAALASSASALVQGVQMFLMFSASSTNPSSRLWRTLRQRQQTK